MNEDIPVPRLEEPIVSVILCSHNPRPKFLERTLDALTRQSLDPMRWELIIVDNCSDPPIVSSLPSSLGIQMTLLHESSLGLLNARIRGLRDARGELLVFVDDDNVLAHDYLQTACEIHVNYPFLGAWGGRIVGEFEVVPQPWVMEYANSLAIRDVDRVRWSNTLDDWRAQPVGAGLCLRRSVADDFLKRIEENPLLLSLGRRGTSLVSGEDMELVYSIPKIGLGFGTFPQLYLTHLMPRERLEEAYISRLLEGIATSDVLLSANFGRPIEQTSTWRTWLRACQLLFTRGPRSAKFYLARKRGARRGIEILRLSQARVS